MVGPGGVGWRLRDRRLSGKWHRSKWWWMALIMRPGGVGWQLRDRRQSSDTGGSDDGWLDGCPPPGGVGWRLWESGKWHRSKWWWLVICVDIDFSLQYSVLCTCTYLLTCFHHGDGLHHRGAVLPIIVSYHKLSSLTLNLLPCRSTTIWYQQASTPLRERKTAYTDRLTMNNR